MRGRAAWAIGGGITTRLRLGLQAELVERALFEGEDLRVATHDERGDLIYMYIYMLKARWRHTHNLHCVCLCVRVCACVCVCVYTCVRTSWAG